MSSYQFSKEDTLCVKALAVMLMMIHHLFGFPEKLQEGVSFMSLSTLSSGHTVMSLAGNFGKLCIALFMILSGYGMYCSYRNNPDNMTGIILKANRFIGVFAITF